MKLKNLLWIKIKKDTPIYRDLLEDFSYQELDNEYLVTEILFDEDEGEEIYIVDDNIFMYNFIEEDLIFLNKNVCIKLTDSNIKEIL